ncbi:MAG: hypothetical protein JST86_00495 [Bacteroidetes bacterium]|nr:hypothetical protein [Bacteroidota bacterium]
MNTFSEAVKQKSNPELLTMVYQFDEWSPEMLDAVQAELTERCILPGDIAQRKQESIAEEEQVLNEGKEASITGIVLGWLGIFGLLGMFIGYNYAFSKVRSIYTGKQYYKYNAESRKTGSQIFYTALVLFIMFLFYQVAKFH